MKRRILWLLAVLFCFAASKANTHKKVSYFVLEDMSRMVTPEQALHLYYAGNYTPQHSNQFNPGFTKSVYWLAVKVDSVVSPDSLRLVVGNPHINNIDFYRITDNGVFLQFITGDYHPYSQRPVPSIKYTFPLSRGCFLYLVRVDKHNESLQLTFDTFSTTEQIQSESNNAAITGLLTGIILLLLIFGLYLSVITRKKIYIFYLLYISAGWLWVISDLGYGFKYIWPDSTWFASRCRPVFSELTIALSLRYLIYYLGGIPNKLLKKALLFTSYICLFFCGLWLIPIDVYEAREVSWVILISIPVLTAVYTILTIITLTLEAFRRNIMALFYLGALVPLMLLVFINIMNHSGMLNISGTALEHYGVAIGYVSEAIILTFGLAYRFNSYRIEKERLDLAFEVQQKENARAIIDIEAKERRKIADELHDIAGSMLSAAKLNITSIRERSLITDTETITKLDKAEEALNIVAGSVRNLSHALSPVMLDKIGFRKSIENVVSFFNTSRKIDIEVLVMGFERYDPAMENIYIVLYSLTYEFLNNIVKHSKASNAILQLIEHEDSITLIVEDNGTGLSKEFDKQTTKGLAGITSKINYFNGSIQFDSHETGLIISIEIPKGAYETKNSIS